MMSLNVNEEKQLTFEVQIGGVNYDQLSCHLRMEIDGIEYGFPAVIGRESVTVDLPALKNVTSRRLKEGEEIDVHLDIIADDNYIVPWSDTFKISNPFMVEAKMLNSKTTAVKTKLVQESEVISKPKEMVEKTVEPEVIVEDPTEKLISMLSNKLESIIEAKFGSVQPTVKEITEPIKEMAPVQEIKKITTKDLMNMTEEDIYAYMDRAGTRNKKVQALIYEQATSLAASGKPVEILKQVVKILKNHKKWI